MASITLFIRSEVICPILRKTICLSTVKKRSGRIYELACNEPDTKSSDNNGCAYMSFAGLDVIWHIIISSPLISVKTKAGRLLQPDRLEKGNDTTTTSPFTNLSMLHPPPALTNLLPKRSQMQKRFVHCLSASRGLFQLYPRVYEPMLTTTVRCFSIYFLLSMFPSFYIF